VRTGKTFEGWAYDDAGLLPVVGTTLVTEADTLYAIWEDEEVE
jgi:uncharacterized repeat protein (TIGR02543 family)